MDRVARARQLRFEGLTYREIAERLGVSQRTAYRWLNFEYAERNREQSRAWKARNAEANRKRDREYRRAKRAKERASRA